MGVDLGWVQINIRMRTLESEVFPQAASSNSSNFCSILCLVCSLRFLMFAQGLCEVTIIGRDTEDNEGEE